MIKGLLFDLNGTLIDILTNEGEDTVYRCLSNFLSYREIYIPPDELKTLYFEENRQQRRESAERYPEFDVLRLFHDLLNRYPGSVWHALSRVRKENLCTALAQLYRACSRYRLELYADVFEVLDLLRNQYCMAAVSDGQRCWALPELKSVGLESYFNALVISSDHGFRKPDRRMFQFALDALNLRPEEVVFIGNDMYRDIYGAKRMGLKSVFFRSNQGDQQDRGAAPDYIIYRFAELPDALRFLEQEH